MDIDHPSIQRALEKETTNHRSPSNIQLFTAAIQSVLCHPNTPEKQDILDEIEQDLWIKWQMGEITLQQRLHLVLLLQSGEYES